MVTILTKVNVDTLVVSEVMQMNIGDTIEVSADIKSDGKEPVPISWQLGQVPKLGKGYKCLEVIGEDGFKGTMTFKAVGEGTGDVTYTIYDGENSGKTKTIEIEVV